LARGRKAARRGDVVARREVVAEGEARIPFDFHVAAQRRGPPPARTWQTRVGRAAKVSAHFTSGR
jgi:hypothetical protein